MPRPLVLGNGTMLVTIDKYLQVRDLYYPYVGMEDHTTFGNVHRLGCFVEGRGFHWISDGSWNISVGYKRETLVGSSSGEHPHLGIAFTVEDYVHPVHNIFIRRLRLRSTDAQQKHVKMFFHHDFHIYGDKQKDTAFYEPYSNSIIHYRGQRYFLIGGETTKPQKCIAWQKHAPLTSVLHSREEVHRCGLSSFTVGKESYQGLEGTWKDAEDGLLQGNTVEHGSVDSTVSIDSIVEPTEETEVTLWLCIGKSLPEVSALQQKITEETLERLESNCISYWKSWVNKTEQDFGSLEEPIIDLFKRSLLIMRAHADNHGGIVAAADSDIMAFNKDTYSYVWPRDGAFVSIALDSAGYGEVSRRFFDFCCKVQMEDGYLLHKYNPDESLGSTWLPWFRDGEPQLPIQEDETALVLFALWKHFERFRDFEFLQSLYECFVRRAGNFLWKFREEATGLPLPSYDPWEEHRGVFSYTTACVIAGLRAAAQISVVLGHFKHMERYQNAAEEMEQAFLFHLFDESSQRFMKSIQRKNGKTTDRDLTIDASLALIPLLDVLPTSDPRVISMMKQIQETLTVHTEVGGLARYPNDRYHAVTPVGGGIPGNPWIITTLWIAQWQIARAKNPEELEEARKALQWAVHVGGPTGILPEQLHPLTGEHLSVAPLTWSHATYVETVLKFLEKEKELKGILPPCSPSSSQQVHR